MPFLTSFVLLPRKLHRASASFTPAGSGTSAKRELWVKPSEELDSCLVPSCHQVWSHRPGGKERIRKASPGSALPDTGQDAAHQGSSAPVGFYRGSAAAETVVSPHSFHWHLKSAASRRGPASLRCKDYLMSHIHLPSLHPGIYVCSGKQQSTEGRRGYDTDVAGVEILVFQN